MTQDTSSCTNGNQVHACHHDGNLRNSEFKNGMTHTADDSMKTSPIIISSSSFGPKEDEEDNKKQQIVMTDDDKDKDIYLKNEALTSTSTTDPYENENINVNNGNNPCHNNANMTTMTKNKKKKLILIRHGTSYANEYMDQPGSRWGDATFTDDASYRDSPLSQRGFEQAWKLRQSLLALLQHDKDEEKALGEGGDDDDVVVDDGHETHPSPSHHDVLHTPEHSASSSLSVSRLLKDVELVVLSPLTRALQTFDAGIYPCLERQIQQNKNKGIKIIAQPLATERVYTASDIGRSVHELRDEFPHVDFESEFKQINDMIPCDSSFSPDCNDCGDNDVSPSTVPLTTNTKTERTNTSLSLLTRLNTEPWWFHPTCRDEQNSESTPNEYSNKEWRPHGQGQYYAVPGEPDDVFEKRMKRLCLYLHSRPENVILIVSHWGVIRHLTNGKKELDNCGVCVVDF